MSTITNSSTAASAVLGAAPGQPAKQKPEEPERIFYGEACARRTPLHFHMRGGQHIAGIIWSFGVFSVEVKTSSGRLLLCKDAIDLVEVAGAPTPANARAGSPLSPAAPSPLRPPMGGAR